MCVVSPFWSRPVLHVQLNSWSKDTWQQVVRDPELLVNTVLNAPTLLPAIAALRYGAKETDWNIVRVLDTLVRTSMEQLEQSKVGGGAEETKGSDDVEGGAEDVDGGAEETKGSDDVEGGAEDVDGVEETKGSDDVEGGTRVVVVAIPCLPFAGYEDHRSWTCTRPLEVTSPSGQRRLVQDNRGECRVCRV